MENVALIDADSLLWAASYNRENPDDIIEYLDMKLGVILEETECNLYKLFVGGSNNFRYHIRGDYKGNRKGRDKPLLFNWTRDYIVNELKAFVSNGLETDDTVCATAKYVKEKTIFNPIVCTIDKDYKIKPLNIYIWEKHIKSRVIPSKQFVVTEYEAMRNFYGMLLTGDTGDNIHTCKGIGGKTAHKMLDGLSKYDMTRVLIKTYKDYYGSRWRYKLTEVYHLINLIDDYSRVRVPKEFEFTL